MGFCLCAAQVSRSHVPRHCPPAMPPVPPVSRESRSGPWGVYKAPQTQAPQTTHHSGKPWALSPCRAMQGWLHPAGPAAFYLQCCLLLRVPCCSTPKMFGLWPNQGWSSSWVTPAQIKLHMPECIFRVGCASRSPSAAGGAAAAHPPAQPWPCEVRASHSRL